LPRGALAVVDSPDAGAWAEYESMVVIVSTKRRFGGFAKAFARQRADRAYRDRIKAEIGPIGEAGCSYLKSHPAPVTLTPQA
jgi:hypothetical protein